MRAPHVVLGDRDAQVELTPSGRPTRLRWRHHDFVVTDDPTPLEDALGALLTHPSGAQGWRFQGTGRGGGEAYVFDVLRCDGGWWVAHVYD